MENLKLLILFGLIIFLPSCSDETVNPNLEAESEEIAEIELRQDEIPDFNFLEGCEPANITFFINPNCNGTVYANAILNGIEEFNNSPTGIGLTQVGSAAAADIVLSCVDGNNCGEGVAFFNDDILDTREANINLEILWENCLCTDPNQAGCNLIGFEPACMFTRTVMHELGHALGIHHNGEGDHIAGTPNTGNDLNSVFNSGPVTNGNCDWCDAPCVFNANDLTALQILYPLDCGCFNPELNGPGNLCVNEEGRYCIDSNIGTVTWFGHPEINGSTENCVELSYNAEGTDFIYADVEIKGCVYHLSKRIEIGPPNIVDNLKVEFDPCRSIIRIQGLDPNPTTNYSWSGFNGLNNNPHVSISGTNNQLVRLRVGFNAGETLCFSVTATSDCGTTSTPCEVCYTTPGCEGKGEYGSVVVQPNNTCSNGECPPGYTCEEGICCEEGVSQGDMCIDNDHCPIGFECINGNCCHILTGLCL